MTWTTLQQLEASTHNSAKTNASSPVTLTFDLLTPKINGFPGLIVDSWNNFLSSLLILATSVFELSIMLKKDRQTAR